jgi:hypothetical protein
VARIRHLYAVPRRPALAPEEGVSVELVQGGFMLFVICTVASLVYLSAL